MQSSETLGGKQSPYWLRGAAIKSMMIDTRNWGWTPLLSLIAACGLWLLALAFNLARMNYDWAESLYWISLIIIYAPMFLRLLSPQITRLESLSLVLIIGGGLYLLKLQHSPLGFHFFDEFLHWRTATDILNTGRIFTENSMLPVSPLYPGLELATTALASLSGLSVFQAGAIIVGVGRIVLLLAIYLFCERVSGSIRAASIATCIYMANHHFLFFDAQFAYESLAIPLALFTLYVLLMRGYVDPPSRFGLNVVAVVGVWGVVGTHHSTAYLFTGFLLFWSLLTLIYNLRLQAKQPGLVWITLVALIANAVWLLFVSDITIGYLAPHLQGTMNAILELIAGEENGNHRELFKSATGKPTPLLERITGIGSVALLALSLPLGILQVWLKHFRNPNAMALALAAFAFPATLLLRLTGGGWEFSVRTSAFVFFPLGFTLGLLLDKFWLPRGRAKIYLLLRGLWCQVQRARRTYGLRGRAFNQACRVAGACGGLIIFLGGIIAGWTPWERLPWPYTVAADTRSIEPQGIAAAYWARAALGRNRRMAADRINTSLMGSFGEQRMIINLIDKVSISGIFLLPRFGADERRIIHEARIEYLVVDRRVTTAVPLDGHYYEGWEQAISQHAPPAEARALNKFDTMPGVQRVFDSGDIRLYDVRRLALVP